MKKYLLASLFMLPFTAVANGSYPILIDRIEVSDTGFNMYSSGGDFTAANCADGSKSTVNSVISFRQTDYPNGYDNILSVALAAQASRKKVTMWYSACQPSPWNNGNMPKASTLVIRSQ